MQTTQEDEDHVVDLGGGKTVLRRVGSSIPPPHHDAEETVRRAKVQGVQEFQCWHMRV
jgi:hypothetical protein